MYHRAGVPFPQQVTSYPAHIPTTPAVLLENATGALLADVETCVCAGVVREGGGWGVVGSRGPDELYFLRPVGLLLCHFLYTSWHGVRHLDRHEGQNAVTAALHSCGA